MKNRTKELLDKISKNHDFADGQTWGHGGTAMSCTDVCRICGMRRNWFTDSQNGVEEEYTFSTYDGEELPMYQAVHCAP